MALAKRPVDPRYFAPLLEAYQAQGATGGSPGNIGQKEKDSGQAPIRADAMDMLGLLQMLGQGNPKDNSQAILGGWSSPLSHAELEDAGSFIPGYTK